VNLLDSSAWIELLVQGPGHAAFEPVSQDRTHLIVPSMVVFEVTRWAQQRHGASGAWAARTLLSTGVQVPFEEYLAEAAASRALEYRLATADAIIYATALAYRATLWTMDAHFEGLPGVEYHPRR
jgi:predicted nucleic acid-binding protein